MQRIKLDIHRSNHKVDTFDWCNIMFKYTGFSDKIKWQISCFTSYKVTDYARQIPWYLATIED